ncbi:MAG: hypothetical protein N3F11_01570 [Casimicrobiaceae bacterium]|nr:hypothetical protein [Casimicrobiaceae bacterium]
MPERPPEPEPTEEERALAQKVRVLAEQRWRDIEAGRWAEAYERFTPAAKATLSLEDFRRALDLPHRRFLGVGDVRCRADLCTVEALVELRLAIGRTGAHTVPVSRYERWRLVDGQLHVLAD